jgi:hypothetical protein
LLATKEDAENYTVLIAEPIRILIHVIIIVKRGAYPLATKEDAEDCTVLIAEPTVIWTTAKTTVMPNLTIAAIPTRISEAWSAGSIHQETQCCLLV